MVERYRIRKAPSTAFKKGMRTPGAGRVAGVPNKRTKFLKDAISGAAEQLGMLKPVYRKTFNGRPTDVVIGWEPSGKGGTQGYLVWLGCHYPQAYTQLLSRILPLQINAQVKSEMTVTGKFADMDFSKLTLPEKNAALREMISLTKPLPEKPKELAAPNPDQQVTDGEFEEVDV